jgi:putative peptidoglycan lipid II flippase
LVAPGFKGEVRLLTIQLVRILFPGVGFLVLSAWCLGILNSHRKFFLSYVAPVLWNAAMIITLVIYGRSHAQNDLAIDLAWGSVVGSVLQFGVQLPFVFKYAGKILPLIDLSMPSVKDVFRNLGPVLVSRGVVQLSAYIDGMIASFLGATAVSSLAYAQTIYLLPVSLFGMAVAAAELPGMSVAGGASEEARLKLRTRLVAGRRNIAFFVIPSAVLFLFLGRSVVAALYQTGQFGSEDTLYVWYVLMGSVVGLLAATWGRLYSSAFYALSDTRTPLHFAVVRVTLTILLGLLFAFPLRSYVGELLTLVGLKIPNLPGIELGLGAVGLTASAGIAGWIEFLLLRFALQKRVGKSDVPRIFIGKVWLAALISAGLALVVEHFIFDDGSMAIRVAHYNLTPVFVIATFGAIYLVFATILRIEEVAGVRRRLSRR